MVDVHVAVVEVHVAVVEVHVEVVVQVDIHVSCQSRSGVEVRR